MRAERVGVAFGRTVALDDVSFELETGVVGLFGSNGSGKSTLLRVAAGLLAPSSGTLRWRGAVVSSRDERFRRAVGYAGHASGLYARLSVAENLRLFARLHGAAPPRVERVIEQVDLGAQARTPVSALSSGMRRRAAVARALLHEPELLLLDEPYANVDDDAAERISSAIRAWRAPGRLAIIATHGAKKVKGWADAGVILQRGRVRTAGRYARDPALAEGAGRRA